MSDKPRSVGQPLKFSDVDDLQKRIDDYFFNCDTNSKPYTITGLALALDTNRQTLINYEDKDEYFDTIKKAKSKCEQYVEEYLFNGKNVAGAIFNLKNNYNDWRDKTEVEHSGEINRNASEEELDAIIARANQRQAGEDTQTK